jgi:opacity protein-like surface antigen
MAGFGRMRAAAIGLMVAMAIGATARDAQAQGIGIGAHMVFVTGADSPLQDPASSSSTKLTGVFMRLRASKRMGIEVSYDWRTARDAENTIEVKSTPIQVSGLFYLLKGSVSPYVVMGAGWYKTRVELLGGATATPVADPPIVTTAETTKFGYHTGIGGEAMLGKHASIFVDYRYTFVDIQGLGGILGTATSLLTGGLGSLFTSMTGLGGNAATGTPTIPNASHLGSMWTTGMTIYF